MRVTESGDGDTDLSELIVGEQNVQGPGRRSGCGFGVPFTGVGR